MPTSLGFGSALSSRGPTQPDPPLELRLMGGFLLARGGRPIPVALGAQRLIAYLAIADRATTRSHVAGTLWTEATEARAMGNLRSALWRLGGISGARGSPGQVIAGSGADIELAPDVGVDVRTLSGVARTLIDGPDEPDSTWLDRLAAADDLLPDWSDEWMVVERERFRQLRLHALERLCGRLARAGQYGRAIEVGQAVVASEPLRETAHRELIEVHLAEGNRAEAIRQYGVYGRLLRDELGLEPAFDMAELLRR